MAQRDAHRAEEVLRTDGFIGVAIGGLIPVGDGVFRIDKLIGRTVGEGELLAVPTAFQLAFCCHTHNALIVNHTPVILKESAVLAGNIHQHRRETVGTAAVVGRAVGVGAGLCPQARLGPTCITMTRAARVACIDRPKAVAGIHGIVIEAVAMREPLLIGRDIAHPVGIRVIGIAGILEDRRGAGRKNKTLRHLDVANVLHL